MTNIPRVKFSWLTAMIHIHMQSQEGGVMASDEEMGHNTGCAEQLRTSV